MEQLASSLRLIQKYAYQIGGPILFGTGTVSCLLNLFIFNKKTLRKNPCSIYMTAYNLANVLIICTSLLPVMLGNGYYIDIISKNLITCRFYTYMGIVGSVASPSYMVLAYIDRIFITSSNARTRQRSTRRRACQYTIAVTLFWLILDIHVFFFMDIFKLAPNYQYCFITSPIYQSFVVYYSLIVSSLLFPLLLIVLGLCTLRNLRRIRRARVAPTMTASSILPAKERQFVRVLIADASVYTIFWLFNAGAYFYQVIIRYNQSELLSLIGAFAQNLANLFIYIPFCTSCYINCIASKTFRKELKTMLFCR